MTWQPNADWERLAKVLLSWQTLGPELEQRLTQAMVATVLPSLMLHRFGESQVEVVYPSEPEGLVVVCQDRKTVTLVEFDDGTVNLPSELMGRDVRRVQLRFRLAPEPRSYNRPQLSEPDFPESIYWLECFGYLESHGFRRFLTKWSRRRFWPVRSEPSENPVKPLL